MTKPPRTLGISLAIIAGAFLFSCLPLTQVAVLLSLNARQGIEFLPPVQDNQNLPSIIGAEVLELNLIALGIQAVLALGFLVVAIITWRGRPANIRFVFVALVILLTAGNLIQLLSLLTSPPPTPQTGMDSSGDLGRTLAITQLCVTLIIPTYIVWYMNRGPARAFFRGHYLPDPSSNRDTVS